MKSKFLAITVAGIISIMLLAVLMIPNPVLTVLLYPYEHGDIPEVRAFYDKFGHSVETATGDENIIALFSQNSHHAFTTLVLIKDADNGSSNYDSRVTCAKSKDVHTITKDVVTFLREYDCFGSKPYPHSPVALHKIP